MKLASLPGGRDGRLVVVSRDLAMMIAADDLAPSLQVALDNWRSVEPLLRARFDALQQGTVQGDPFRATDALSPLPRAFQWADGSVYPAHMERMSRWLGKDVPESFWREPWVYQGCSDGFLNPHEAIKAAEQEWGIDFEAEIAVITDDVPMGIQPSEAGSHIKLVMLCNDVSLRNLIPGELAKGFGFMQSKPASAFSPVAVTPDELGGAWREGRLHRALRSFVNDQLVGDPDAGEMQYGFPEIIAHIGKTRQMGAGSIVGSGTVANRDPSRGVSCLAERRVMEIIETGEPRTPYLGFGDRVKIEMLDDDGSSIFGAIEQRVERG
jgi:fumarylacetoacetate (FAA) hydrolase